MCITFSNVFLSISNKEILHNINLKFIKGFNLIQGASGSGKTSILKLINILYSPANGRIFYKGKDIDLYKPNLWRSMCILTKQTPYKTDNTAMDYLQLPFSFAVHNNKSIDKNLLHSLLDTFMLNKGILDERIISLSGGELQRIAIIRTILLKPKIFLFDEPTSSLDENMHSIVMQYIHKLSKNHICIVVSHSSSSTAFSDTLTTISEGRVVQ